MNTSLWRSLPFELVNLILEYDGVIKFRNGKFINQLIDIDFNYHLILERMRFHNNHKFSKAHGVSIVNIRIPNTEKYICYWADENEFRVVLHRKDKHIAKILYYIKN